MVFDSPRFRQSRASVLPPGRFAWYDRLVIRSLLSTAASSFDTAVGGALLLRRSRPKGQPDPEALGHAARMEALAELRRTYDRPEHYEPAHGFFPAPAPISPAITRVRPMGG